MNPIKEIRKGLVKAAVFEKTVSSEKFGEFKSRSVALQVGYKDKTEVIQNKKINLTESEVKRVIETLTETLKEIKTLKEESKKES